jgi:HAE1 family hydrophobic/amphiphilic exporter-1
MVISLFDSLTIAPMLSAYMIGKVDEEKRNHGIRAIIYAPARWFNVFYAWFERFYEKTIKYTLKHKILILFLAVVIFIGSLVPVFMNKIPMTFMPKNEFGEFIIDLEAAQGTSLSRMDKYAVEIDELLRKEKDIKLVSMSVGNSMGESNVAELFIELVPEKERKRSTSDMKEYVRKLLAPYKETLNPSVNDIGMAAGQGKPFTMIISGENLVEIGAIADNIKEKFKKIPGLIDVDTSYKTGKPEYQIKMVPAKMVKLGVQSVTAGMELRGMVEGMIPAKYRENGLEYDIRVKLQDNQRDLSREFGLLYVPNVNYQLVKLKNVADPIMTTGPAVIERYDRSRYIEIFGNLDKTGAVGTIKREARKIMEAEKLPEGISYEFVGTSEMFEELIKNMIIAAGLSIIFIYLVLASLYESLIMPFTIMLALPLSTIGGLIALFITHQQLSMFTMIGLIMLLGLAAKNSILLIDYTQRMIRSGMKRDDAIIRAGVVRLRPILMTSFALIAGMLPLALGLTEMGKFRQSMGIAVIGGLISSTFLTLVVIPAVFGYMDDLRLGMRKLLKRPESREIDKTEEITAG